MTEDRIVGFGGDPDFPSVACGDPVYESDLYRHPIRDIDSDDIRRDLHFAFHFENGGSLTLYTPHGAYRLSPAAAEDLMTNFEVNLGILQARLNR